MYIYTYMRNNFMKNYSKDRLRIYFCTCNEIPWQIIQYNTIWIYIK